MTISDGDVSRLKTMITGELAKEDVLARAKDLVLQGHPWDRAIRMAREELQKLVANSARTPSQD